MCFNSVKGSVDGYRVNVFNASPRLSNYYLCFDLQSKYLSEQILEQNYLTKLKIVSIIMRADTFNVSQHC